MALPIPKMRRPLFSTFTFLLNPLVRKSVNRKTFDSIRFIRSKSTSSANFPVDDGKKNSQWQLMSAICLERKPIVTQMPNELETRFKNLMHQLEYEQSLKSDHEMRHQEDVVRADQHKRGELDSSEIDAHVLQTAQDIEDAGTEELAEFPLASRLTEADKANDQTSLKRALENYLVLVVRQKLGSDARWVLPQGPWKEGETMRQTAERVLKTLCGNQLKAKFVGNAPCGFYKYKFPRQMWGEGKPTGAKVFFFKAQYMDGNLQPLENEIQEFKWLKQDELKEFLRPSYFEAISSFLIEIGKTNRRKDNETKAKPIINRIEN